MEEQEFLLGWTKQYLKHKDMIARKITGMEEDGNRLLVRYKDDERTFIMMPVLNNLVEEIGNKGKTTIVTFNTKHNLSTLISFWDEITGNRDLCLIFINPASSLDKKWIIFPHTHSKISDESSLEEGLKAIFETVEPLDDEKIKDICKA